MLMSKPQWFTFNSIICYERTVGYSCLALKKYFWYEILIAVQVNLGFEFPQKT